MKYTEKQMKDFADKIYKANNDILIAIESIKELLNSEIYEKELIENIDSNKELIQKLFKYLSKKNDFSEFFKHDEINSSIIDEFSSTCKIMSDIIKEK